jgi:asparaginyl-tRNA synthetase
MITFIKHALSANAEANIEIAGWIRSRRDAKAFSFLEVNDGSCLRNLQVIVDQEVPGYEQVLQATTGSSVRVAGRLLASPAAGQKWELRATHVEIIGGADATYPLQKKGHSVEFLRTIAHLRPRSNLFGAVFRLRSRLAYAVHQFFQERDFVYVQTPIITASDCEGAGELFRVTTLKQDRDQADEPDFFGKATPNGQRPTGSRDVRLRVVESVHLWAYLSGRGFEYLSARGGVLDDRTGDGFLRPTGGYGPRRGVRESNGATRPGALRG